ncbi:MAG TPA: hypothetical protein VFN21_14035 [Acidimicrobiales bacterium]|nr:hypothetical protein [Acidimicrobiales bacterium]
MTRTALRARASSMPITELHSNVSVARGSIPDASRARPNSSNPASDDSSNAAHGFDVVEDLGGRHVDPVSVRRVVGSGGFGMEKSAWTDL